MQRGTNLDVVWTGRGACRVYPQPPAVLRRPGASFNALDACDGSEGWTLRAGTQLCSEAGGVMFIASIPWTSRLAQGWCIDNTASSSVVPTR